MSTRTTAEVRAKLLQQLSHAQQVLNYQEIGFFSLQIVRSFISNNHYTEAYAFVQTITFPSADQVDPTIFTAFTYYLALIHAVFLQYDVASAHLSLLLQGGDEIITQFHIHVYRLFIVVSLLLGQIPQRSTFNIPILAANLSPIYFNLTQTIRTGDLDKYYVTINDPSIMEEFTNDNMAQFVLRLEATIVGAKLKQITNIYHKLSLEKVGELLQGNVSMANKKKVYTFTDIYGFVTKSIADGTIEAYIDDDAVLHSISYDKKYESIDNMDTLLEKTKFVITLRQQAQQSLRFPSVKQNTQPAASKDDKRQLSDLLL